MKRWFENENGEVDQIPHVKPGTLVRIEHDFRINDLEYGMVLSLHKEGTAYYWPSYYILVGDTKEPFFVYEFEPCHH